MNPPARWAGGLVRAVAVPGGALAVEQLGTGPPLLLLHGWTLDRRMWLPQAPLARHFTLVGIDRRGFGQSTAAADLRQEPDDVLRIADALGIAHFHILGMSQGGRVTLALAARAPDRLLSLTLQGTALDGGVPIDEGVPTAAMAAAAKRGDLPAMRALWQAHPLMQTVSPVGRAGIEAMLSDYKARDLLVPQSSLPATADAIRGLSCPVTAIVGAADTDQRLANARELVAAGARALILSACGHLCNFDDPVRFNAAMQTALRPDET